jgi:hypothetical protein
MAMAQNPHLLNVFMSLSPSQRESLVGTLANTAADVSRLTDLADSADIGKG